VKLNDILDDVTAQPLGSILEAKPLCQGQKTRILGQQSKSCSHSYSRVASAVTSLSDSNAEILKATPPYKIDDCLHRHHPLDGIAFYPPGITDPEVNTYQYSEGSNMMTEPDMSFMRDLGMKFTNVDFANDPFYSGDRVGPLRRIRSLRKALSPCKRLRKATARLA